LDPVVLVEVHLDVFDDRAAPDALEGDAVELVVGTELDAGKLHAQVAKDARTVVGIDAAVEPRLAFADADTAGQVDRGAAVDDQTTPVAATPLTHGLIRRHHDRRIGPSIRNDLRPALDDERAARGRLADDPRPRLD